MELWAVLMGDGTFSLEVIGVSNCQPELKIICGGDPQAGEEQTVLAILVPEETSPYSPEAVRVQIWHLPVGYLARPDTHAFLACLNREAPSVGRFRCRAKIRRAWDPREEAKQYWSVYLDVCLPREVEKHGKLRGLLKGKNTRKLALTGLLASLRKALGSGH